MFGAHLRHEFPGAFFPFRVPTASVSPRGAIAIPLSFADSYLFQILGVQLVYCDGRITPR